jgi:hypothetical protein
MGGGQDQRVRKNLCNVWVMPCSLKFADMNSAVVDN